MNLPLTWLAGAALLAAAGPVSAAADEIDAQRWRSRLLVVVAPDAADPRLARQRQLFEAGRSGTRERDLVLIARAGPEAEGLRRRYRVGAGEFRSILVGKDGGAKLSASEPLDTDRLFGEIDRMPMRREEMRRGGGQGRS